jgi:hypothetical protein
MLDSMDSVIPAAFLKQKTYATFDGIEPGKPLSELCFELLAEQKLTWPLLRDGSESLRHMRKRLLPCSGFAVLLQQNPGRMKSTMARVREEDTSRRPCFLCLPHLPEAQKGILYRGEYLILCNPMPVFSAHFTVARTDHRPQVISGHMDTLLQLMADFGPGWTILYNGPQCGASAPDHFHFQAVPSGHMPIEKEILEKKRLTLIAQKEGVIFYRIKDAGREVIILEGDTQAAVGSAFTDFLNGLRNVLEIESRRQSRGTLSSEHGEPGTRVRVREALTAGYPRAGVPVMHEEPMINVAGSYAKGRVKGQGSRVRMKTDSLGSSLAGGSDTCQGGRWRLLVFPRSKHRPDAFFKKGSARIAVSPAVIEMGGVLVTPFARDFERLDAATVESIYREVSLERESVETAVQAVVSPTGHSTSS